MYLTKGLGMTGKKNFIISGIVFLIAIVCGICFFYNRKAPVQQDLTILFRRSGNISEYKTTGFSGPETDLTWTDGKEASIEIPLPEIREDQFYKVSIDAFPFIAKRLQQQRVKVFVNDEFITDFVMTKNYQPYKFNLPRDAQKLGKVANIKFDISNPTSPKSMRLSNDTRKLGVAFKSLNLSFGDKNNPEGFEPYKIGDTIDFTYGGNSKLYTVSGWSAQETNLTWTDGSDANLNLMVKDVKDKSLRLIVEGSAIFDPKDKYQNVTVYVNGKELTTWSVTHEVETHSVILPADLVGDGLLQIRFHIAKPYSPKPDTRKLGFAVKTVLFQNRFGVQTKNKIATWFKNKVADDVETTTENK